MKEQLTDCGTPDFSKLLCPTYIGPEIRRYFGEAWSMHLPFAWDLMRELQPQTFVELGVYRGESYFTFCQSVEENGLATLCYGIDTWEGDVHTGTYGSALGREVETYNSRYSGFSKLLKMTFNEALPLFPDASVDLLHIDGSHRYEDIKQDFEHWLPKLSGQGIILLHDIMVRDRGFGVWRLWLEIANHHPTFVFEFGHGLGVWKKRAVSAVDSPWVRKLFHADEREQREIVSRYAIAAAAMSLKQETIKLQRNSGLSQIQAFSPRNRQYSENQSRASDFPIGRWCRVRVDLPWGLGDGSAGLRFDPGKHEGLIEIAGVLIRSKVTGNILWRAKRAKLRSVAVGGTATLLPYERVLRILSFGIDPEVILPILAPSQFTGPLILEVWMRLDTSAGAIARNYREQEQAHQGELLAVRAELQAVFRSDLDRIEHEARQQREVNDAQITALRSRLEYMEREAWENKARRADATARLKDRDRRIQDIEGSAAWKLLKPLWKLERHFSAAREENSTSANRVFAVDTPNTLSADDVLTIRGWCYARTGAQVVGVRAKIGRKSYLAKYGLKREDAEGVTVHDPATLYSGFAIELPISEVTSPVRLEAIAQGCPWECFQEHSPVYVRQESRAQPRPSGKRARESLVLYPDIGWNEVLSVLAPMIQHHITRGRSKTPFFSVVSPTCNTAPRWLTEAGASLLNQTFADWEWCLVDDGSQNDELRSTLEALASAHPAFRVKLASAGGISAANNTALEFARGKFICFLDHDDLLDPEALAAMAEKVGEGFDVVYSDEDKFDDQTEKLLEPFFKPDWSPEYFRGVMYVGHLLCVDRDLASRVKFDSAFDGVQDFEFMLRLSETRPRIGHVARILYHWRKIPGSIAENSDAKPHVATLQQEAVNAHLQRLGLPAKAESGATPHRLKIVPAPRTCFPKISIIIPTKDSPDLLSLCLNSLYKKTSYSNFEVILIDNDTTDPDALKAMRSHPVIRLYLPDPFNFSRANNLGAKHATGEYLVFLNNDTEIMAAQWLDHLLYYSEQPDVGATGALLFHEDGAVQHGGVVLGIRGTADHSMRGFSMQSDGYAGNLSCAREVSAVTAACMMVRKSIFKELRGFNEHFFTIYQDLDFCLRLRERGLRIIWTPQALLVHHESVSRQTRYDLVDRYLLLDQWEQTIGRGDPYYNPNLNLERGDYSLRT
jgi:O-antigen biosynthesis protein